MLRGLCILAAVAVLLTGCGARNTMYDMGSYKNGYVEDTAVESKSVYKTYAEEIYNGEISVDTALEVLGCGSMREDSKYYEAFISMIDAFNSLSKEDIKDYYGRWGWLNDVEKLTASYMVMYNVLSINLYDEDTQHIINKNIKDIQNGR